MAKNWPKFCPKYFLTTIIETNLSIDQFLCFVYITSAICLQIYCVNVQKYSNHNNNIYSILRFIFEDHVSWIRFILSLCKLLVLDKNTLNDIIVYKWLILIEFSYIELWLFRNGCLKQLLGKKNRVKLIQYQINPKRLTCHKKVVELFNTNNLYTIFSTISIWYW